MNENNASCIINNLNDDLETNKNEPQKSKKLILFNKKFDYTDDDSLDNEVDEAVKADYDADEDDNYELNEIIIENPNQTKSFCKKLSSKYKKKIVDQQLIQSNCSNNNINNNNINNNNNKPTSSSSSLGSNLNLEKTKLPNNNTDTTSSSESGFGTVDDEVEIAKNKKNLDSSSSFNKQALNKPECLVVNKTQGLNLQQQNSVDSVSSNIPLTDIGNNSNNIKYSKDQMISFPILQPPRQIVYELNMNHSDDIVNILNDNSSMNSSTSSDSNKFSNCCSKLIQKLISFYYSCFCCYSTSSSHHKPILCSWITIFCCCCPFLGGISLYLTHRSKKYKSKQKYDLADKYSNYAEKLNIAALIFGIIFYAIGFFMITLVIFMYWRPHNS